MNAADPFVRALTGDQEHLTVSLIRSYRATVAELWDAITSPERIARAGTARSPVPCRVERVTPSRSTSAAASCGGRCWRAATRRTP